MKKIIFLIALFMIIGAVDAFVEPKIYYKVSMEYNNPDVKIKNIDIEFSREEIKNSFGFYSASLADLEGKTIEKSFFSIPKQALAENFDENGEAVFGEMIEINKSEFEIYIPYNEKAKTIEIYNESLDMIGEMSIAEYSKKTKEEVKTPVARYEEKDDKKNYWGWLILVMVIVFTIIIYYLFIKLKKNKK